MSQAALVSLKANKGVGGGGINGVGEGASMRSWSAGLSRGGGRKKKKRGRCDSASEGNNRSERAEESGVEEEERSGNNGSAGATAAAAGRGAAQPGPLKGPLKAPLFTATPGSGGLELRRLRDAVNDLSPRRQSTDAVNRPARSFPPIRRRFGPIAAALASSNTPPKKITPKKAAPGMLTVAS